MCLALGELMRGMEGALGLKQLLNFKKKHDDNILGYFKSWLTELDIFFFPRSKD